MNQVSIEQHFFDVAVDERRNLIEKCFPIEFCGDCGALDFSDSSLGCCRGVVENSLNGGANGVSQ